MSSETIILAGNGPYENRGCEAIVRGTVDILDRYYEDPSFIVCSHFRSKAHLASQQEKEYDKRITHIDVNHLPNNRLVQKLYRLFPTLRRNYIYQNLKPFMQDAHAVLSVGGDNYSLDYGIPQYFTDLDDFVAAQGARCQIWGASVGPFTSKPAYERYMASHLQRQGTIFARESATIEYLAKIGVTRNVCKTVDPAFVMKPKRPGIFECVPDLKDTIGINLSPLLARYVCNRNDDLWFERATELIRTIRMRFESPLLLIPHVVEPNSNDYLFLRRIQEKLGDPTIKVLSDHLGAAEIKWVISQLQVFAGARTHSTIAAFSSFVPTISFSYSIKAEGLNKDIFGNLDYCIRPHELEPDQVCNVLSRAIENRETLRFQLRTQVSKMIETASKSGALLPGACHA